MADGRYVLVLTEAVPSPDPENFESLPAGMVVNSIVWDGETHYDPGPKYRILKSDTLQVGDMADG